MSSDQERQTALASIAQARRRIGRIFAWTADDTEASYLGNDERQAAIERQFIAIGEAVKDLGKYLDLSLIDPSGPWKEAERFRDFLAHQYDEGVSHPDIWRTIQEDLPILDAALARVEAAIR